MHQPVYRNNINTFMDACVQFNLINIHNITLKRFSIRFGPYPLPNAGQEAIQSRWRTDRARTSFSFSLSSSLLQMHQVQYLNELLLLLPLLLPLLSSLTSDRRCLRRRLLRFSAWLQLK